MFKTIKNLRKLNKVVEWVENIATKFADFRLQLTELKHKLTVVMDDIRRIKEQLGDK